MSESAYDSLVGEFIWMGIKPKHALKFAGLLYPHEELYVRSFRTKANLNTYIEIAMEMWFHKYEEFDIDESFTSTENLIDEIKRKNNYSRVHVYIDGANLLRSFAFINETITSNQGYIERKVSINLKNYKSPSISKSYPIWYMAWVLLPVFGIEKAIIDKITFVMCADDKGASGLLKKIKKDFGFDIIIPSKNGTGLKSSSNEDKYLKDLIMTDLTNDVFDIAIIGTGDGNKKDGISFPEIAKMIEDSNKKVLFAGFDLTTSKKIKEKFEFNELAFYPFFPRMEGPEIISLNEE
jgi:hypothetical protein